jgi:hypothetical protein
MAEEQNLPATHRALVQNVYSEPFTVEDVPTPSVVPGSAILRIESVLVISYQKMFVMVLASIHIQLRL